MHAAVGRIVNGRKGSKLQGGWVTHTGQGGIPMVTTTQHRVGSLERQHLAVEEVWQIKRR